MTAYFKTIISTILLGIINTLSFSMVQLTPIPSTSSFQVLVPTENLMGTNIEPLFNLSPVSDRLAVYEQDKKRVEQYENQHKEIYSDLNARLIIYDLPGNVNMAPDIKSKPFKKFQRIFSRFSLVQTWKSPINSR